MIDVLDWGLSSGASGHQGMIRARSGVIVNMSRSWGTWVIRPSPVAAKAGVAGLTALAWKSPVVAFSECRRPRIHCH